MTLPRYDADTNPTRPRAITWEDYETRATNEWSELLASNPDEKAVQHWMELHPSFVPGGSGSLGLQGGNHGSEMNAVIREAPLKGMGKNRRPDFMWVTHSSSLVTPVLVEIEKPSKPWFNGLGRPSAEFTQALDQIADWKVWFSDSSNREIFRKTYLGEDPFPDRYLEPQYVLVYGRTAEFEPTTSPHKNAGALRLKRDFMRRSHEVFLTFDSLRPDPKLRNAITVSQTSNGPTLHAISPTFQSGPVLMTTTERITDYQRGLARSVYLDDDRRAYLGTRWAHWKQEQAERKKHKGTAMRSLGGE